MANDIVWFDSTDANAPVLNNAAGSLDAVLHACLVTGYNTFTATSVTVTSEVATLTYAGHGVSDQRMVLVAGAGTPAINGRKVATRTGSGSLTFPAPGVADGTIGGTIVVKRAPLGWARPLSSGNVSIYTRTDPAATAMGLRVDDSATGAASPENARIRMLETWSDLSTFTNPAPPASHYSGAGFYVTKGTNNATAKSWFLIGDGLRFYLLTDSTSYPSSSTSFAGTYGCAAYFGDIKSDRAGDAYHCMIAGEIAGSASTTHYLFLGANTNQPGGAYSFMCRAHHGIGQTLGVSFATLTGGSWSGVGGPLYPSPVQNGFRLSGPALVMEQLPNLGYPIRGELPGSSHVLAAVPAIALNLQWHDSVIGSDRRWLTVGSRVSSNINGCVAFDLTGPW